MNKEIFDSCATEYNHPLFKFLIRYKGNIILENTKGLVKGLDCGCGIGQYADYLNKHGCEITGIDISRNMIRRAMEESKGTFMLKDMMKTGFKDKEFEFCYAINVLHHLGSDENIKKAIKEMRRVAHKIIIIEIDINHPLTQLYLKLIFKLYKEFEQEVCYIDKEYLEELIGHRVKNIFFNVFTLGIIRRGF